MARAELGAMSMMQMLLTEQPTSEREMQGAMTMIALNITTPMDEPVNFPGPEVNVRVVQN